MGKRILSILIVLCFFALPLMANDEIKGLWKTVDDKSGEIKSIVKVYDYDGKVFGRILVTYGNGILKDTYTDPTHRSEKVEGKPYTVGLDFLWDMENKGKKWKKGKIMDPEEGKVYSAEMWREGKNLVVRGKIGPFGRNQTWLPAKVSDFPEGVPDPVNLVPVIHR